MSHLLLMKADTSVTQSDALTVILVRVLKTLASLDIVMLGFAE